MRHQARYEHVLPRLGPELQHHAFLGFAGLKLAALGAVSAHVDGPAHLRFVKKQIGLNGGPNR